MLPDSTTGAGYRHPGGTAGKVMARLTNGPHGATPVVSRFATLVTRDAVGQVSPCPEVVFQR